MIRQPFAQVAASSKPRLIVGVFVLLAFGTFAVAPAAQPQGDLPPLTIKFTKNKARSDEHGPKHGYFCNAFLPKTAPQSRNRGAFACSDTSGTATYLQSNKESFHRVTKFKETRTTDGNIVYYLYAEPKVGDQQRTWAFEAAPNEQGNCAIYYQINDGAFTLFQVADKVPISAVPPFSEADSVKGSP